MNADIHPGDEILLCLLDGEVGEGELATAGEHLAGCELCQQRTDLLRRRKLRLAELLARTDFPVPAPHVETARVIPLPRRPARPAASPWRRAAAVALLVLTAGLVGTTARAWITGRLSAERSPAVATPPAPPEMSPPAAAPQSEIRFVPAPGEFSVEVAHPQEAGALTLLSAPGDSAIAAVVAGTGAADLLVLPLGLRIGNSPGSAAEYRVAIPGRVRQVRVRIAGRESLRIETAQLGPDGTEVSLGRR